MGLGLGLGGGGGGGAGGLEALSVLGIGGGGLSAVVSFLFAFLLLGSQIEMLIVPSFYFAEFPTWRLDRESLLF